MKCERCKVTERTCGALCKECFKAVYGYPCPNARHARVLEELQKIEEKRKMKDTEARKMLEHPDNE